MDVIFDQNSLLKEFDKTIIEIDETEKRLRALNPDFWRKSSSNFERSQDDPRFLPRHFPVDFSKKLPELRDSSESSEEIISEEEIPSEKVYLKSAVYTGGRNAKSKRDVISQQNQKVRSRNRRILGVLQSTLQKFRLDAAQRRPQDLKRQRMEEKIEAAKEEEKHRFEREKKELLVKINQKKLYLDCIKEMMQITKPFSVWKHNEKKLLNFITTKAEPQICYLPKSLNSRSARLLEKSRIKVLDLIRKKEAAMQEELKEIIETYEIESVAARQRFVSRKEDCI